MGHIFYIMGKSASGKDKLYGLLQKNDLLLKRLVLYTTRPIRSGEENGREYFFINEEQLEKFRQMGKVVEERTYQTVAGPWTYCTVHDEQMDLSRENYLAIGTLESYVQLKAYYGEEVMVPLYIEVSDENRLKRAMKREAGQAVPNYKEMCRRFLADCEDFSEERIREAGITHRFDNNDALEVCLGELEEWIKHVLSYS